MLGNSGYTGYFHPPSAGRVTVEWNKQALVASGTVAYPSAGLEKVTVTLTRYGRGLLRGARRVTLTATGSFTLASPAGETITTQTTITLRR